MKNDTTLSTVGNTLVKPSIPVDRVSQSRLNQVNLDDPGFGQIFSDHMLNMHYRDGEWKQAEIIPFGNISYSPAMATLHYGQTVFEGMKAFRTAEGEVQLFRPMKHLKRLNNSCRRMCIPEIDPEILFDALRQLLQLDQKWVPSKEGNALYIRPIIFAEDAALGVKPAETYRLLIITSPVGSYYKEGINPVSLTTNAQYIRAAKGGSGAAKTACNYGPTLLPAMEAQQEGFTQVIWLDATEHKYIEEVGTMNIFFKIDGTLYTPPASGSILSGITRDSVIALAKDWNVPLKTKQISIDNIFEAHKNNTLEEVFGTGTAAVISPVGSIHHEGQSLTTDEAQMGPFAQKLYNRITSIQYGKETDSYGWMTNVS